MVHDFGWEVGEWKCVRFVPVAAGRCVEIEVVPRTRKPRCFVWVPGRRLELRGPGCKVAALVAHLFATPNRWVELGKEEKRGLVVGRVAKCEVAKFWGRRTGAFAVGYGETAGLHATFKQTQIRYLAEANLEINPIIRQQIPRPTRNLGQHATCCNALHVLAKPGCRSIPSQTQQICSESTHICGRVRCP